MVVKRINQPGRRVRVAGRAATSGDRELAEARPDGRRGVAGSRADAAVPSEETATADSGVSDAPGRIRRTLTALRLRGTRGLVAVIVLSAILGGGLAYWFHTEAQHLRSAPGAGNEAVVDPVRTNEVATQISDKLVKLWSYDYAQLDKQQDEVRNAATSSFLEDYAQQFQRIKELAPAQQAVVDAKVVDLAVSRLHGDRAELVVFLNQVAAKGDSQDTTRAAARLWVSAELVDGQWLVSAVTPF